VEALRYLSLGSKAGDENVIGKFGLGLKSVFHLTEVYFYLSDDMGKRGFLNPWSPARHSEWDSNVEEAIDRLVTTLPPFLRGEEGWFCLYLPLRSGLWGEPFIVEEFPGSNGHSPTDLLDLQALKRIAGFFPLLKHLSSIRFMRTGIDFEEPAEIGSVSLGDSSERHEGFLQLGDSPRPLHGSVRLGGGEVGPVGFSGFERLAAVAKSSALQLRPNWPRSISIDPHTTKPIEVKIKATSHVAVYFTSRPCQGQGSFATRWSVFLPLEEDGQPQTLKTEREISLYLHGYFFVDSGRRRIEWPLAPPANQDERQVRLAWNALLRDEGILPLVLPALDQFVREESLTYTESADLTQALSKSSFIRQHLTQITHSYHWIPRIEPNREIRYALVPSGQRFLVLPSAGDGEIDMVFSALPELKSFSKEHCLILGGAPSLAAISGEGAWDVNAIRLLLESSALTGEVAEANLAYVSEFVHLLSRQQNWPELLPIIKTWLRNLLTVVPEALSDDFRKTFRSLVLILPSDKRWRAPFSTREAFLSKLLELSLDIVPIPKDLWPPQDSSTGVLTMRDAEEILRVFNRYPEAMSDNNVMTVIRSVAVPRHDFLRDISTLPLFRPADQRGDGTLLPLADLLRAKSGERLFSMVARDASIEAAMCSALVDRNLTFVSPEVRGEDLELGSIPPLTAYSCGSLLASAPLLSGNVDRIPLLQYMVAQPNVELHMSAAIRYLLHGNAAAYHDTSEVFVSPLREDQYPWGRICKFMLSHAGEAWRLVPSALAGLVPPQLYGSLDLVQVTSESVLRLVAEHPGRLTGLGKDDRAFLLRTVEDVGLLRMLPVWTFRSGMVGYLPKGLVYRRAKFLVEDEFLSALAVLADAEDRIIGLKVEAVSRELTAATVLDLSLNRENPEVYSDIILRAMADLAPTENSNLRNKRWVPTNLGPCAPIELLLLPGLEDVVDSLAPMHAVPPDIRDRAGFIRWRDQLLRPMSDQMHELASIMSQDERLLIGGLRWDSSQLTLVLQVCGERPEIADVVFPVWKILKRASDKYGPEGVAENMLPLLVGYVSPQRTTDILNFFARGETGSLHKSYLPSALRRNDRSQILRALKLKNRSGQWRKTESLCADIEGVALSSLLDQEQEDALREVDVLLVGTARMIEATSLEQTADAALVVLHYFKEWEHHVPQRLIGGFLALLGDQGELPTAAERLLGGTYSVSHLRDRLPWDQYRLPGANTRLGESAIEAIGFQRFLLSVVDSDEIEARNVLGQVIRVPTLELTDVGTIWVGLDAQMQPADAVEGMRVNRLQFRRIPVTEIPEDRLVAILKTSAQVLLKRIYGRNVPHDVLEERFWSTFLNTAREVEIRVAENLLAESAFFYLRQMDQVNHDLVRAVLRAWDDARKLKAQEDEAKDRQLAIVERAGLALKLARQQLISLIKDDANVQRAILDSIRRRIRDHYQYRLTSIPFELLQNADDAVLELCYTIEGPTPDWALEDFVISTDGRMLCFQHWGRPINSHQLADKAEGRRRGFDRDLEKMLTLSASDKSEPHEAQINVTGKFGLGFKSCYMASDSPQLLSADLGFSVIGGMLPARLSDAEKLAMESRRRMLGIHSDHATLIVLGVTQDVNSEDVLRDFRDLLEWIPLFTEAISRIRLIGDTGTQEVSRQLAEVPGCASIWMQRLRAGSALLVTSSSGEGKLLLWFDETGFKPTRARVPTVWVTVPTKEMLDLGFAINAHFELDVGRAQLARTSQKNEKLAVTLARGLGESLMELSAAVDVGWEPIREALELRSDLSCYDFWRSLWEATSRGISIALQGDSDAKFTPSTIRLLARILWQDRSGALGRLFAVRSTLPTLLHGEHRVTTSLSSVRWIVKGILARLPQVFESVSSWPEVKHRVHPGDAIAEEVFDRLLRLLPNDPVARSLDLDLRQTLAWVLEPTECKADADLAARMGPAISRELFASSPVTTEEREAVLDLLREVRFQATNGQYRPAQLLLIPNLPDAELAEEHRRAAFAPADRVLHSDYGTSAIEFIRLCRQSLQAVLPTELADWIRQAGTSEKQASAVDYLLQGERRNEVSQLLQDEPAQWLIDKLELQEPGELNTNEWAILLGLLGQADSLVQGRLETPSAVPPPHQLESIFDWWTAYREKGLPQYYRAIYPDGRPIVVVPLDPDALDLRQERKRWIQLFMLGASQTIGRVREEQNRDSLVRLDAVISELAAVSERGPTWLRRLEEYLDRQQHDVEYFQWVKEFVSAFAIARRLEDYIEGFRLLDHKIIRLDQVTRLRENELLMGSGIEAPPISNVLGVGVCFVVRDLVRQGFVTHPNAHRYCYLPVQRLRKMFAYLGCAGLEDDTSDRWERSRMIYDFLADRLGPDRAAFCGDFDIPFLLIWRDPAQRQRWFPGLMSD
jgi:hypothetical protein